MLMLGLAGIGVVVSSVFIWTTLSVAEAPPLTYDAMIRITKNLPEVKAFLDRHPQHELNYGDKTSLDGIGYVNYNVGGERGMNALELEVLISKTTGEIAQTSIVCFATQYSSGGHSPDYDRSFNYTDADLDIAEFIRQGRVDICGVSNELNQ
jgi:hypothetical protein